MFGGARGVLGFGGKSGAFGVLFVCAKQKGFAPDYVL